MHSAELNVPQNHEGEIIHSIDHIQENQCTPQN